MDFPNGRHRLGTWSTEQERVVGVCVGKYYGQKVSVLCGLGGTGLGQGIHLTWGTLQGEPIPLV